MCSKKQATGGSKDHVRRKISGLGGPEWTYMGN